VEAANLRKLNHTRKVLHLPSGNLVMLFRHIPPR
jgi:hypothetical protein